jgi:hypothetical protein
MGRRVIFFKKEKIMSLVSIKIYSWASKTDPQFEKLIIQSPWKDYRAQKCVEYARKIVKGRWKKGEKYIKQSSYYSYLYAKTVIKGRWIEAEKYIKNDCRAAYLYARYVLKNRFIEAEKSKAKDSFHSGHPWERGRYIYLYSKYVLKSRWKSVEKYLNNDYYSVKYAVDVKKCRDTELENYIIEYGSQIKEYYDMLQGVDKEEFYNKILMQAVIKPVGKYYNPAESFIKSLINKEPKS